MSIRLGREEAIVHMECGRFRERVKEVMWESLRSNPPGLCVKPGDSAAQPSHTAVLPGTSVRAMSVRPTSNQARTRMGRSVRSLGRLVRDGEEGQLLVDQKTPLADGPRPASPGAPFVD